MIEARRHIRVTHVITRLIVGGAQENTVATVLGLQQNPEFEVDLISGLPEPGQGSLEGEFRAQGGALVLSPNLVRPIKPIPDWKAFRELTKHFQRTRPVIVHTHSGKAGIVGRWAAHRAGVPIVIHTIHGPSFGSWQGALANLVFRKVERSTGRITTHFVAVANAMIEQYLGAGIGELKQYSRIFSGFPLHPYLNAKNDVALRNRFGIAPTDLVIGKIARFFELKGHDDLFALMPLFVKEFPAARFLLIGGGPWEDRFKQKIREQPELRDKVIFTGLVPPAEIPALTGIMDMLVHLSVREGLPRALPQALAAGKPVIAYDGDGAPEVCIEDCTGILVHAGDRKMLLAALKRLAADAALRERLGASGRQFVSERFSVETMVEETRRLYLRLLGERNSIAAQR